MTIAEFREMEPEKKCQFMNARLELTGEKNFKGNGVTFTAKQAAAALTEDGAALIDGSWMTQQQALEYLARKKEQEDRKYLTPQQAERLEVLLSDSVFERLTKLSHKYDFVSEYILKESADLKAIKAEGTMKTTSFRVSEETLERWKAFCQAHGEYSSTTLLNTALIEFLDRH